MSSLETFLKDFKIVKSFKETGQKRVFLAEHSDFGRVMVKVGRSPNQARLNRAIREVEVQRSLDSRYYPRNFDFQVFDDFQFVIIEEFIDSQPLSESYENFSDPLSILRLLDSLVDGLDLLWRKKTTHRDLKPDNILIKGDGSPVIIDLGIVLAIERTDITPPYAPFSPCTPRYAAPEQLKNRRADVDHRTDQFILGIDVMELASGGLHPFDPAYVGCGTCIEENIIHGRWAKERLRTDDFVRMGSLVDRLLGREPYMRFRNTGLLKAEIKKCIEAYT